MSFHNLFFRAIDFLYEPRQNRRRCTRFVGVEFDIFSDIVYSDADPQICKLDIYRPGGARQGEGGDALNEDSGERYFAKLPVVFYLHGGGFEAGDKFHRRALSRWLATLGYAVVNVNYGLAPKCKFPAQHRQIAAALNFVSQNAQKYGLDLSRIVVAGDSAGAYYASALACICNEPDIQQKLGVSTTLKFGAAILNCGVYDMHMLATKKMIFSLGRHVFEDTTGGGAEDIEKYKWKELCNVPSLVTPDFPPSLVIYSCRDILCKDQHTVLLSALKNCGVPFSEFSSVRLKDNHCFSLMWKGKAARQANEIIAQFLTKFKEGEFTV